MKIQGKKLFTEEQIKFIEDNYRVKTDLFIAEKIGKDKQDIINYRFRNGLPKRGKVIPLGEDCFSVELHENWIV